jgi:ribose transport system permease protein
MASKNVNRPAAMFVRRVLIILAIPIAVFLLFRLLAPLHFGTLQMIFINFQQAFLPSITAWGLCFVMTLGLYDLSVGAIIILSAIITAKAAVVISGLAGVAFLLLSCVILSAGLEFLNATVYIRLRIPSIIVTIGLAMIYESVSNLTSGAELPFGMSILGRAPMNIVLGCLTFLAAYILYNRTRIGFQIKAVGGSEVVARNSGIDVDRTKVIAFLLCGVFAGIAGVMTISYGGAIMPSTNLDSISRIFPPIMGYFIGIALQRYCNIIIGVFVGEFSILMIVTGLMTVGIPTTFQQVITGVFLLLVVGTVNRAKRGEVVK